MIDLKQRELSEWQEKNFGKSGNTSKTVWCVIGMSEELGELSHFLLKRKQKIREGASGGDLKKEIGDAFADVIIYGIQAMTCEGIDAEQVIKNTISEVLTRNFVNNPYGEGLSQHKQEMREVDENIL